MMNTTVDDTSREERTQALVKASDGIASAANACRDSLARCLDIESLRSEWAEHRLADFNLWDLSVGASCEPSKTSSLEKRLKNKEHIRDAIMGLLRALKMAIDHCKNLGQQIDRRGNRRFTREMNVKSTFGRILNWRSPKTKGTDNAVTGGELLLQAVQTADTLLNDLVRLGIIIRRSANKSRNLMADRSFDPDSPDLQALRKQLIFVIFYEKGSRIELTTIQSRSTYGNVQPEELKRKLTTIQSRLIDANLRRNHRFRDAQKRYLDKHRQQQQEPGKQKQQGQQQTTNAPPQRGPARPPNARKLRDTLENALSQLASRTLKSNEDFEVQAAGVHDQYTNASQAEAPNPSETNASAMDPEELAHPTKSIATSQLSGSRPSTWAAKNKSQYPQPPDPGDKAQVVKCPCCCVALDKKKIQGRRGLGGSRWRTHINADLLPYTCVLRGCNSKDELYANKKEWISHMTEEHEIRTHYWECPICKEPLHFGFKDAFEYHLETAHPKAIAAADLPTFLAACSKPKILGGSSCPLCSFAGTKNDTGYDLDQSGQELLNHVAEHVHSFSLRALPWFADETGKKYEYFEHNPYFDISDRYASLASSNSSFDERLLDVASNVAHKLDAGEELEAQPFQPRSSNLKEGLLREWNKSHLSQNLDDAVTQWNDFTMAHADPSYLREQLSMLLEANPIGFDPEGQHVPDADLQRLINTHSIQGALGQGVDNALVTYAMRHCRKTFAILQLVFREPTDRRRAMQAFQASGFTDDMLESNDMALCDSDPCLRDCRHYFPRPEPWDAISLRVFEATRWQFLVPTFKADHFRYEFDSRRLLPFKRSNRQLSLGSGNFSDVTCVEMLADKQVALGTQAGMTITVAHKTLRPLNMPRFDIREEWIREAEAHRQLNGLSPHIVQGIAAYHRVASNKENDTYHIVMEWADGGNLFGLWHKESAPQLDADIERSRGRVRVLLEQLLGLANALECLHTGVSVPSDQDHSSSTATQERSAVGSTGPHIRLELEHRGAFRYWRHGDIKPENILRFTGGNNQTWLGTLKLADLGRAQHHELKTALRDTAEKERFRTRWYEPPDLSEDLYQRAQGKVSRLFDIWSMGCVIFESVLWLLYGSGAIENLQKVGNTFADTPYWRRVGPGDYRVTEKVSSWMEHIVRPDSKRGSALQDLVELVRDRLLRVDLPPDSDVYTPGKRTNAKDLKEQLTKILEKALQDCTYLFDGIEKFEPQPFPNELITIRPSSGGNLGFLSLEPALRLDRKTPIRFPDRVVQQKLYTDDMANTWQYLDDHEFAERVIATDQIPYKDDLCSECSNINIMSSELVVDRPTLEINSEQCALCELIGKALDRVELPSVDKVRLARDSDGFTVHALDGTKLKILRLCCLDQEFSKGLKNVPVGAPDLYNPPPIPKAADAFMRLPKAWLEDCDRNHGSTCAATHDNSKLPLRLVDLRSNKIKIVDSTGLESSLGRVRYVAFSYKWGDMPQHVVTTRKNVQLRRKAIPRNEIPSSFADAIAITKALGCDFLWIDALCIMAGHDGDFVEQAGSMETTFSNAYCVIAAASAAGANKGFLSRDTDRSPLHSVKMGNVFVSAVTNDFSRDVLQSPLSRRGWTLQERALACRTLFFTETQMYFECGDGIRCETLQKLKHDETSFLGDANFPSRTLGPNSTRGHQINLWTTLVKYYTTLQFSYPADRAFALNALIDRLASALKTRSLAGLFESIWGRCLLWKRTADGPPLSRISSGPHTQQAPPSWSWMAFDGPVDFLTPEGGQVDWNTDVVLPFARRTPGSHLQPTPQARTTTDGNATDDAIYAHALNCTNWGEEDLYFDDNTAHIDGQVKCVIICTSTDKKEHHVLLVLATSQATTPPTYERVGVGRLPASCIDRSSGVEIAIR